METHQVGPEQMSKWDFERITGKGFRWLVYWYKTGDYEGDGLAVGMNQDGTVSYGSLGHCSCYGPTENFPDKTVTLEEFMAMTANDDSLNGRTRMAGDFDFDRWQKVGEKVAELTRSAGTGLLSSRS